MTKLIGMLEEKMHIAFPLQRRRYVSAIIGKSKFINISIDHFGTWLSMLNENFNAVHISNFSQHRFHRIPVHYVYQFLLPATRQELEIDFATKLSETTSTLKTLTLIVKRKRSSPFPCFFASQKKTSVLLIQRTERHKQRRTV